MDDVSHGTASSTHSHSIAAEKNFRRVTDRHTLKLYRTIMAKSYLPQKHVEFIADLYASERMPMGRVSQQTYEGIFTARSFDRYGKMVSNKLSDKEKMIADLQATLAAQASGHAESHAAKSKGTEVERLKTEVWKIGYKPAVYGPPGLAPPLPYVLKSEGNERFYSYDGDWDMGGMNGGGTYKFADGMFYEGGFVNNRPHGKGKATYSSGTVYEGEWVDGFPCGAGVCNYQVGTKYDGAFKEGKRHGFGVLVFPTESYYKGDFLNGRFNGRGEYYSKDTGIKYVGWFDNGFVAKTGTVYYPNGDKYVKEWPASMKALSFRKAVMLIEEEKMAEGDRKRATYARLYSAIRESELQSYVTDVREEIKEERADKKRRDQEEKRRIQRENREKERENRLKSLLDKDGEAVEGAEEEVKMLRLEIEEAQRAKEAGAQGPKIGAG
jgi:hypothetical protein